jgi:Coenzyme PQQ synthesis protein D (PqqD)
MILNTTEYVPPKRKHVIARQLDQETLIVDEKTNTAHCLNATASRVWELCDGENSVGAMIRDLSQRSLRTLSETVVWMALGQIRKAGLLPKEPAFPDRPKFVSRRELVRNMGVSAALALPMVTTILLPTAAQAASCRHNLAPCTSNAQCCSGLCSPVAHVCVGG